MLQFDTPERQEASSLAIPGSEPIQFQLDGVPVMAYPPTNEQMMLYAAMIGRSTADIEEMAAGVIDFLDQLFDEDGRRLFRRRLLDRHDPFNFEDVLRITRGLLEEWGSRPTEQSSASTSQRRTAGK